MNIGIIQNSLFIVPKIGIDKRGHIWYIVRVSGT